MENVARQVRPNPTRNSNMKQITSDPEKRLIVRTVPQQVDQQPTRISDVKQGDLTQKEDSL